MIIEDTDPPALYMILIRKIGTEQYYTSVRIDEEAERVDSFLAVARKQMRVQMGRLVDDVLSKDG